MHAASVLHGSDRYRGHNKRISDDADLKMPDMLGVLLCGLSRAIVDEAFQHRERVGVVDMFVRTPAQYAWETHGHAGLVTRAGLNSFEADLEHERRAHAAHRAEFIDGGLAHDRIDLT